MPAPYVPRPATTRRSGLLLRLHAASQRPGRCARYASAACAIAIPARLIPCRSRLRRRQLEAGHRQRDVGIGAGGADERPNFAIWYSYYRTRSVADQERGEPGLHAAGRQLPRRLHHGRAESLGGRSQADRSRQVPADRRLRLDPAQPPGSTSCSRRRPAAPRRRAKAWPGSAGTTRGRARRHQKHRGHVNGTRRPGPVLVPAELHHHDDGRLLERAHRNDRSMAAR